MLAVELIDAKQPLAGDLCPLRPPAHYSVTNMAEGWLKPLTAPLDEVAADDETTVRHRLESCCRMLTASHFWYSRSWHHAGIRFLVRRTVAKQRGSKIFLKKRKKEKTTQTVARRNSNLTSLLLKFSLPWHVIALPQRLLGKVTRTPWMFFFFFFFLAFLSM